MTDNTLHVLYTLAAIYFGCIVLLVLVAVFFAKSMVKPILDVTENLKHVAQGEWDLARRIAFTSHDEIGEREQITFTVNNSAAQISSEISSIAQAMDTTPENLSIVAVATEEMTGTPSTKFPNSDH